MYHRIILISLTLTIGAMAHDITNIQFSPPSPASLDWDEMVTITFDYQTEATNGIRVDATPLSSMSSNYNSASTGSSVYTAAQGQAEFGFTLLSGETTIDSVIIRLLDDPTEAILFETTVTDLAFTWPKVAGGDEAPYPRCSEIRVVPHLTAIGGVFDTTIMVENFSNADQAFSLTPYGSDGAMYNSFTSHVEAGETKFYSQQDLFGPNGASWFTVNNEARVLVTVAFISTGNGSPAFSQERCVFGKKMSLTAGDWNNVFDGIAVVNLGSSPANIEVKQYDKHNQLIQSETVLSNLPSMGKGLYVLDTHFTDPSETRFVIESDQKVAILALSGSHPGSTVNFLWENHGFIHE